MGCSEAARSVGSMTAERSRAVGQLKLRPCGRRGSDLSSAWSPRRPFLTRWARRCRRRTSPGPERPPQWPLAPFSGSAAAAGADACAARVRVGTEVRGLVNGTAGPSAALPSPPRSSPAPFRATSSAASVSVTPYAALRVPPSMCRWSPAVDVGQPPAGLERELTGFGIASLALPDEPG